MQKRILVVDDEVEMREAIKHVLRTDYEVIGCEDGLEALDVLRWGERAVDLVITDLRMPVLGGVELLIKIKERSPSIPVIVMSVYFEDDPGMTTEIEKRVDRIVRKPLDLKELKRLVEELLNIKREAFDQNLNVKELRNTNCGCYLDEAIFGFAGFLWGIWGKS